MQSETELLFIGLPETGKTTYFVALDEVLNRQSASSGLVNAGFAENRGYIETAKTAWRAGKDVGRTNLVTVDEPVELLVRQPATEAEIRIVAPDVNGEFFEDQWADRRWSASYRSRLSATSGIFAFINAAHAGRNAEMTEAWLNLPVDSAQEVRPWTPRDAARQVKLFDLLQLVASVPRALRPLPVAVIVSAWDLVGQRERPTLSALQFLKDDWSLVYHYLEANPESFRFRVYGVSARGGDDAAQGELLKLPPYKRVWLQDDMTVSNDLTRPLRWLLGWP